MHKQLNFISLKKRGEFVNIAKQGRYVSTKGLTLQVIENKELDEENTIRFGITASKKVGNAVVRNRVKRRLRPLIKKVLNSSACIGFDYVVIGKKQTKDREFSKLEKDLKYALYQAKVFEPVEK